MLRITLAINADTIADYEVRNVTPGAEWATCEVRKIIGVATGPVLATVPHPRSGGATAATAAATSRSALTASLSGTAPTTRLARR